MFCILSFIVLSIMGIFSATHRRLAKDAFACVFKRVTFKPCDTDFKQRMQATIVSGILSKSARAAKIVNKNFELISFAFFILTVGSVFWTGKGLVNYYMYGSCNGLNKSGFCALDPKGEHNKVSQTGGSCSLGAGDESKVNLANGNLSSFPKIPVSTSKDTLVFIGCYSCDYTRKTYPLIKEFLSKNKVNYIFAHYPVKEETTYLLPIGYCAYKQNPDKFWNLNDVLFSSNKEDIAKREFIDKKLNELGYDVNAINSCSQLSETNTAITRQRVELEKTNIYGTPLVFINQKGLVGPKPYRVYERILKGLAFWK